MYKLIDYKRYWLQVPMVWTASLNTVWRELTHLLYIYDVAATYFMIK
jgi:hypothetical protein